MSIFTFRQRQRLRHAMLLARVSAVVGFSSLAWNAAAQHYHLPAGYEGNSGYIPGRWLDAKAVRDVIEDDIAFQETKMEDAGSRLQAAARAFNAGYIDQGAYDIAIADWREEMYQSIKAIHLNYAAAARGGFHNMKAAHYGRVGGLMRFHIDKLDNYAQELRDDPNIALNTADGRMLFEKRNGLYAKTALYTYERERLASHKEAGYDEYENVPHSKESCTTVGTKIGCAEITAKGRHKIGTSADIGKRACGPMDLCTWIFFKLGVAARAIMSKIAPGAPVEGRALLLAAHGAN